MMGRLTLALIFMLFAFGCAEPVPQETTTENVGNSITEFVKAGKPLAVEEDFDKWIREDGGLSGEKANNMLYASQMATGNRYSVKVMLTLSKTKSGPSPTALIEVGGHHISLQANDSSAVVGIKGPYVDMYEDSFYGNVPFEMGVPFECLIEVNPSSIEVFINRKPIRQSVISEPITGKLGVYPAQGRTTVHEFVLDGEAQPIPKTKEFARVFERGEAGYNTIRIPAIIRTKQGTLLAFGDGRVDERGDFGNIDLVMKRSEDNGATWGELEVILDAGDEIALSAPGAVVNTETGKIHVVLTRDNTELIHISSTDDGKSWCDIKSISGDARDIFWPDRDDKTTPGHFIQLKRGKYAGRLLMPVWLRDTAATGYDSLLVTTIYSDDDGDTWQQGGIVDPELLGSNESSIVELNDGRVLLNIRVQDKTIGKRALAYSSDGGATWTKPVFHDDLPDPVCHASMLGVTKPGSDQYCILFTNPFNPMYRNRSNLTLRISCDNGETWPVAKLIHEGPAGYSDLVHLPDGKVGILFEYGHLFTCQAVVFEVLELEKVMK